MQACQIVKSIHLKILYIFCSNIYLHVKVNILLDPMWSVIVFLYIRTLSNALESDIVFTINKAYLLRWNLKMLLSKVMNLIRWIQLTHFTIYDESLQDKTDTYNQYMRWYKQSRWLNPISFFWYYT